ncbi:MAG: hypothetical protein ACM37W_11130, partial [Actinomycetota bacterium]
MTELERLLSAANQVREEFQKNCPFPLILWINDEVLKKLMRVAPDFESWATATEFRVDLHKLKNQLKQGIKKWFTNQFKLEGEGSLKKLQAELEAAERDLLNSELILEPEIKAILASLKGAILFRINQINLALEQDQIALQLWQQLNHLDYQAKILGEITLCYYQKAIPYRELEREEWQVTQSYLSQFLAVLQQIERPDLAIASLLNFRRMLRRLQGWEAWEPIVKKIWKQHQIAHKRIAKAQDYAFLAEAAIAKEDWIQAKEYAELALEFSTLPLGQSPHLYEEGNEPLATQEVIAYTASLSQFILAQTQQHLGQLPTAIHTLENILEAVSSPKYDPQLYLDILNLLHSLYWQQNEYLKAFEIKLKRQSIEQQYGFRAFVGAGRIQPQREAKLLLTQVEHQQETMASEIEASGRYLDVEKLIGRIGRNDCKLLVIHGQSGVGKSSLVQGGLVPALKQKSIDGQDYLPILVNVYTNWVAELGRVLSAALAEKKIELKGVLDSPAAILEQLRQSESYYLRTVLFFDQFEEFFFVYTDPVRRREFFQFLGECLKILSLKVILSLREDYLHYLLECNRLDSMAVISHDILSKNVLYPLGNFAPEDAKAIIQRLTERSNFYLEPTLIDELVPDLASELDSVRPIELQVVGAQLQTENITKFEQYRERGPKQELVKRYLEEVVNNCGEENREVANLVLFLLTNEKGTRPLKTREELEQDLNKLLTAQFFADSSQLDLVLKIFVGAGMVLLFKESPTDRYQLVHDYLAMLIYQQQKPKLDELAAALGREKELRRKAEEELQQAEAARQKAELDRQKAELDRQKANQRIRLGSVVLIASLVVAAATGIFASLTTQNLKNQQEVTGLERDSFKVLKQFEFQSIEALLSAMRAAQDLKRALMKQNLPLEQYPTAAPVLSLQTILDNIQERNQLKGHQAPVISANFSPDGQRIVTASADKTAIIWDLSGKQIAQLQGHQD